MARSFNQVTLMGNLTRDPELRTTPNGQSVCSFSLALNRSYKGADGNYVEATDFVDVTAWGPLGERVSQYVTKGRPVLVSGRLQSRAWEQDGQKRSKVEVVAQDVTFLGGRGEADPQRSAERQVRRVVEDAYARVRFGGGVDEQLLAGPPAAQQVAVVVHRTDSQFGDA